MPKTKTPRHTRDRVVEAAGEIFAELGFQAATIRKISARAKVNIAAVNYYFGGKQALYEEVLRRAFLYRGEVLDEPEPANTPEGTPRPPEVRLRERILLVLEVGLDPRRPQWHRGLFAREFTQPSPAMKRVVREIIHRRFSRLRDIVRDLVDPGLSETQLVLCTFSVLGQCLFFLRSPFVLGMLYPDWRGDPEVLERLADHITEFSLRALRGYGAGAAAGRRRGESGPAPAPAPGPGPAGGPLR